MCPQSSCLQIEDFVRWPMLMRSQLQHAHAGGRKFGVIGGVYFCGGVRYISEAGESLRSFCGCGASLRGSRHGGGPMDMLAEVMLILELLSSCQSAVTSLKCAVGLLVCDCRSVETHDCWVQSAE
jgi:hypothetical protein